MLCLPRKTSRREEKKLQTPKRHMGIWINNAKFHTPLYHTPSFTHITFHTQLCHTPSFTHNFVTHHLSHTTLSHTIFHTTFSHTIFHTPLCQTPSFTHHFVKHPLSHTIFPPPSPLAFLPSPSPLHHFWLIIGRNWLVGLSGPFICVKASVCTSCSV